MVTEYEIKFDELSRYAIEYVAIDAKRAKCFEQGLRPSICEKLVALRIREYKDLVERANLVERDTEEARRRQTFARGGPLRAGSSSGVTQRAAPYR